MSAPWASSRDQEASSHSTVCSQFDTSIQWHPEANWCVGGVGATYQFTRDSAANLRQKNDTYNEAIGGFASGLVLGLASMSLLVFRTELRLILCRKEYPLHAGRWC